MTVSTPSAVTRILHWTIAIGIIAMIAFGTYIASLERGPDKTALLDIHKSLGVVIGLLAAIRLMVRVREGFPPAAGPRSRWEASLARASHHMLLLATVLLPLTGMAKSITNARPVEVFGMPFLPVLLAEKNGALNEVASVAHTGFAWLVVGLLALHVGGALKHHFVDGDDTVRRMLLAR